MTTSSLYDSAFSVSKSLDGLYILGIIAIIVAIFGTITILVTFLKKENEGKFTGFLGLLYDTLTFKKLWLKPILKVSYLMLAIYMTIYSFGFISIKEVGWKLWLGTLIIGNILLRVCYEAIMMFIGIYENSKEMNEKMPKAPKPQVTPQGRPVMQQPVQRPMQQQPVQRPVQPQQVQQPVQQTVQQSQPQAQPSQENVQPQ